MEAKYILFIVLSVLLVAVLIIGILLKKHTNRQLNDIDGFGGIYTAKDCPGKVVAVLGETRLKNGKIKSNKQIKQKTE